MESFYGGRTGASFVIKKNFKTTEEMINFFKKGNLSDVNYGEYVIIDTDSKNNPDNGKVYRRSFNNDDPDYIGQIVGPQGESPEIELVHFNEIGDEGKIFTLDENDTAPGSKTNDDIKYKYVTIRDEFGNVTGCNIAFHIPYFAPTIEVESINPYDEAEIEINPYTSGKFYQSWKLKIPKGIHGIDSKNIEIIPSKTMLPSYKAKKFNLSYEESKIDYYNNVNCTPESRINSLPANKQYDIIGTLYDEDGHIIDEDNKNPYANQIGLPIRYNGEIRYVKKSDCYMNIIRYCEIDYNNGPEGNIEWYYLGDFNTVDKIDLSKYGEVSIFYTHEESYDTLENKIKWINPNKDAGIQLKDDGTLVVYYNTIHARDKSDKYDKPAGDGSFSYDYDAFEKAIKSINRIELTNTGTLVISYNDSETDTFENAMKSITSTVLDSTGTLQINYNNGTKDRIPGAMRSITDVSIDTKGSSADGKIGDGTQKVTVKYNDKTSQEIGEPINYIIESRITSPDEYKGAPYGHLYVYYSDPLLRNNSINYPSEKFGKIVSGWVDLGEVIGPSGGLHIIGNVENKSLLENKKPEDLKAGCAGWSMTVGSVSSAAKEIMVYDYKNNIWYSIGTIDSTSVNPVNIILKSDISNNDLPDPSIASNLNVNGIWLATTKAYCAY